MYNRHFSVMLISFVAAVSMSRTYSLNVFARSRVNEGLPMKGGRCKEGPSGREIGIFVGSGL